MVSSVVATVVTVVVVGLLVVLALSVAVLPLLVVVTLDAVVLSVEMEVVWIVVLDVSLAIGVQFTSIFRAEHSTVGM